MRRRQFAVALSGLLSIGWAPAAAAAPESDGPYWHLNGQTLTYVRDESDAWLIALRCRPGPFVIVETPIWEGRRHATISLSSKGGTATLKARVIEDVDSSKIAHGRIGRDDPVLRTFQSTGKLSVSDDPVDAQGPRAKRAIAKFFSRCPLR